MEAYYAASEWGRPCINMFRSLALAQDYRLLDILTDPGLDHTVRTYAAEFVGHLSDAERVVPVLTHYLAHPITYVREGAVYGLERHIAAPGVRELLTERRKVETSRGVRAALADALMEEG